MPEARLKLTLPEEVWVGRVSRAYPESTFRVLAAIPDGTSGTGLVEITAADVDAVVAAMREYEDVTATEVLSATDCEALVQFETSTPLLLLAAQDSGVPLEMPFELVDGTAVWELTASSDRLSELGTQLRTLGVSFTLESLTREVGSESLLTDTQERLVCRAIEAGYYDTPRECSLTDLAGELDIAKSTASETLHRAEGKIIRAFVDHEQSFGTREQVVDEA
jgi:predicted DNA binding protein